MRVSVIGGGAVLVLLALHGAARAGGPVDVAATATVRPDGGGWTEIVVTVKTGPRAWVGDIGLVSRSGKLQARVALSAHGQRVLTIPFWVDAGAVPPRVRVDGHAAGDVIFTAGGGSRTLAIDAHSHIDLPRTPLAYESLDAVVLGADDARALEPAQARALESWAGAGGVLGVVDEGAPAPLTERRVGDGLVVVARSAPEMRATLVRHTGARSLSLAGAMTGAWERGAPVGTPGAPDQRRVVPVALVVATYVGLLCATAVLADRWPPLRRRGLVLALLVVGGGALATWSVGHSGGGSSADVEQVTLVSSRPDGTARLSAVAALRAARPTLVRFATTEGAAVRELEAPRTTARPDRAVRWDVDRAIWERGLALGESITVRIDAVVPGAGIRVARAADGTWSIANTTVRTLRSPIVMRGGRPTLTLADLRPGASTSVDAAAASRAPASLDGLLAFWRPLLANASPGDEHPALLAMIEPALEIANFGDTARGLPARTYLVASLPLGDGRR